MPQLHLISCIGVRADLGYLPHFLDHYSALGVAPEQFRLILQSAEGAGPALERAQAILKTRGIVAHKIWTDPYTSTMMWAERRALQQEVAAPDDWVLSADVDEFHEYPAPLEEIMAWCARCGHRIVQGPFIDRLAASGRLEPVPDAGGDIAAAFPLQTELRHFIAGYSEQINLGGSVKLMLMRGDVLPGTGGHGPLHPSEHFVYGVKLNKLKAMQTVDTLFRLPFLVHHYKWTEDLQTRMRRRLDTPGITPQGRAYAEKLLAYFGEDAATGVETGRLTLRDPARDAPRDWKAAVRRLKLHRRLAPQTAKIRRIVGALKRTVIR